MDWMKDDGIFMPMLNDTGRNQFYQQALAKFSQDQVVCDIGAGTGVLSIMAAKYGAKQVFAVEKDRSRCEYLRSVIDRLNMNHVIQVVQGDFLHTDIAADVYVSETINSQIFGENMIQLSNHALQHRGRFIPGGFNIWVEVYKDHPVFILDLADSEAYEFDPGINIDTNFENMINQDFTSQYNLNRTIYTANCLNRLFTMLPRFSDLKLQRLGSTKPVCVDLNQYADDNKICVQVPFDLLQNHDNAMLVLKWQVFAGDVALNSDQFWFGNVAKPIRQKFRTQDQIELTYAPELRNWRLKY